MLCDHRGLPEHLQISQDVNHLGRILYHNLKSPLPRLKILQVLTFWPPFFYKKKTKNKKHITHIRLPSGAMMSHPKSRGPQLNPRHILTLSSISFFWTHWILVLREIWRPTREFEWIHGGGRWLPPLHGEKRERRRKRQKNTKKPKIRYGTHSSKVRPKYAWKRRLPGQRGIVDSEGIFFFASIRQVNRAHPLDTPTRQRAT